MFLWKINKGNEFKINTIILFYAGVQPIHMIHATMGGG